MGRTNSPEPVNFDALKEWVLNHAPNPLHERVAELEAACVRWALDVDNLVDHLPTRYERAILAVAKGHEAAFVEGPDGELVWIAPMWGKEGERV